jgi:AraC-like DNA-binding protein
MSIKLVAAALGAAGGPARNAAVRASDVARVAETVQWIERRPGESLTLNALAREAGLSTFHFLRTFERVTGVTPHQYVVRSRLRAAAAAVAGSKARVIDVALDSGFGDVSNFNRAFRAEFGVSPRLYRRRHAEGGQAGGR